MSERLPRIIAFDASRTAYLSIIEEATAAAGCVLLPYDQEPIAVEDVEASIPLAVVTALSQDAYFYSEFSGKELMARASSLRVPYAAIAPEMEDGASMLGIVVPNLYIPKKQGVVGSLSAWLIDLQEEKSAETA